MKALLKDNVVEALVGLAVLAVAIGFVLYAYQRTGAGPSDGYTIAARFPNVAGVNTGTDVRISGMKVGSVAGQRLDPKTFMAVLDLTIDPKIKLPIDSSAAITQEGILGGSYVKLTPGGDPVMLKPGEEIDDTQGAVDLMGLVGSYINKSGSDDTKPAGAPPEPAAPK